MSILISQSSPTIRTLHSRQGPGGRRVPNRPYNNDGELFATGGGLASGWSGLLIDRHGGMQVTVGNARHLEGKNVIHLWNHDGDRTCHLEVPVRPVWYSADGRNDLLVSVYLRPEDVRHLGLKPGDQLALQPNSERQAARTPVITLAPIFDAAQVLPRSRTEAK